MSKPDAHLTASGAHSNNSILVEILSHFTVLWLKSAQPITMKFCTCHDSVTVVTCKISLWSVKCIMNDSITDHVLIITNTVSWQHYRKTTNIQLWACSLAINEYDICHFHKKYLSLVRIQCNSRFIGVIFVIYMSPILLYWSGNVQVNINNTMITPCHNKLCTWIM